MLITNIYTFAILARIHPKIYVGEIGDLREKGYKNISFVLSMLLLTSILSCTEVAQRHLCLI